MQVLTNLDEIATNEGFGSLVGMSRQAVAGHRKTGVLPPPGTYREWLLAYCEHLRSRASGRQSAGEFDLTGERARLAAEQADRVAMENAQRRGELVPREALVSALADVARQIVAILEGVPAQVKRASATIKPRELAVVKREIDKARGAIADVRLTA